MPLAIYLAHNDRIGPEVDPSWMSDQRFGNNEAGSQCDHRGNGQREIQHVRANASARQDADR